MSSSLKGVGIGLSPDMLEAIDAYAHAKAISRAEVIRLAIGVGLPLMKLGVAVNTRRTLGILEYAQMTLSMIVEREYPDVADELLQLAERNVDHYHA